MNESKQSIMSNMKISIVVKDKLEKYKIREGCKTLSDAVNLLLKVDEFTKNDKKHK